METLPESPLRPWRLLPDLVSRSVGGAVVTATDECFGAATQLISPDPPRFSSPPYRPITPGHDACDAGNGRIVSGRRDGWETHRRRRPGNESVVLRLGIPGTVRGVVVDTSYVTADQPMQISVEASAVAGYPSPGELAAAPASGSHVDWRTLVARAPVSPDSLNEFDVDSPYRFTHVRLSAYPDGAVSRLRVHGEAVPDPGLLPGRVWDLASVSLGGRITAASDEFYGAPGNLILPDPPGGQPGWQTPRRRGNGAEWVVLQLAVPGRLRLAELDTTGYAGNAPAGVSLRGIDARTRDPADPGAWFDLLPRTRVQPDTRHRFPIHVPRTVTHTRLMLHPDGGMARVRLWGRVSREQLTELARRLRDTAPPARRRRAYLG